MASTDTERTVIRQSLWRPILVAGGERDATTLLWGTCIFIPVMFSFWLFLLFLPIALIGQFFLKSLAKKDPIFINVSRLHWSKQATYSGLSYYNTTLKQTKVKNNKGVLVIIFIKLTSIFIKDRRS